MGKVAATMEKFSHSSSKALWSEENWKKPENVIAIFTALIRIWRSKVMGKMIMKTGNDVITFISFNGTWRRRPIWRKRERETLLNKILGEKLLSYLSPCCPPIHPLQNVVIKCSMRKWASLTIPFYDELFDVKIEWKTYRSIVETFQLLTFFRLCPLSLSLSRLLSTTIFTLQLTLNSFYVSCNIGYFPKTNFHY